MLVPGHIVSCYLATGGVGGSQLGTDEKEIICLVFGIIDLQTKEVAIIIIIFYQTNNM